MTDSDPTDSKEQGTESISSVALKQDGVADGSHHIMKDYSQDTDFVFEIPAKDAWKKATLISKLFLRYSMTRTSMMLSTFSHIA